MHRGSRSPAVRSKLIEISPDATVLESTRGQASEWIKLLRVHQWSKNALVFVPLVTAEHLILSRLAKRAERFLPFRWWPLPFTFSTIWSISMPIGSIRAKSVVRSQQAPSRYELRWLSYLFCWSLASVGAWAISSPLAAVLLAYLALTTAYTFVLKRKMLVDVLTLASLYTIRVIGWGGGDIGAYIGVAAWLLDVHFYRARAHQALRRTCSPN